MSILFGSDTSAEMEAVLIDGYRRMPPAQKLRRVVELSKGAQQMALARIRKQYPNATEDELKKRLASLHIDADTMQKAFDWNVEVEGR